jgi:molybdopterin-guanine dinucleotide biosynthesis protein A
VNDRAVSDVTAFVLAGGKSSRMGSDKAFLQLDGETLLCRALKLAGLLTREIKIVGKAEKFAAFGSVIEDVYPDRGPLGGIHAALSASATELNLMLAVDVPFVVPEFLEYLIVQARESRALVTVARVSSRLQPLCAIYRREFANIAGQSLREGKNKIDGLFAIVETRVIEEDELVQAGFWAAMFRNLNTPEDLEEAMKPL